MGGLMSKHSEKSVNLSYLSGDDVWRYMRAKKINPDCLRCGKRTWELHDTSTLRGTAALFVGIDGTVNPSEPGFIPQVTMSCRHCGTMWTISRGYIRDWLDANPEISNSDIQNTGAEDAK
jgi:ribosomal protein L37E